MTETIMNTDLELIISEVNDHQICCESSSRNEQPLCSEPARWILWRNGIHACTAGRPLLVCDRCKKRRVDEGIPVSHSCGFFHADSRKCYTRCEAISK